MGFFSFLGRLLFASLFILSAWQMFNEFGDDGGPAAKELLPKLSLVKEHVSAQLNVKMPEIDVKQLVVTFIVLKGVGGILFIFGQTFGAYLLLVYLAFSAPLLYDFYNYNPSNPKFLSLLSDFLQSVSLFGALLFFWGMKNSMPKRQLKKKPAAKTTKAA